MDDKRELDMTDRYIQVSIHETFDGPRTVNVLVKQRTKTKRVAREINTNSKIHNRIDLRSLLQYGLQSISISTSISIPSQRLSKLSFVFLVTVSSLTIGRMDIPSASFCTIIPLPRSG